MAAKPFDQDPSILSDLADLARKLIDEFIQVSDDRQRSTELLSALEHVVSEFKRLRPPLPLKQGRALRLFR